MSKLHRFEVIDLYRGFGAICIFIAHGPSFMGGQWLPQAYLALDVFFVMSGFVIAHGFDAAIARGMTLQRFFLLRVIRFYPAYIAALLCTLPLILLRANERGLEYSGPQAVGVAALELFMLPTIVDPISGGVLYPYNGVCWSLFFEMVVNLIFFVAFPWLSRKGLLVVLGVTGIALVLTRIYTGTMNLGFDIDTAIFALPKLSFAFFMGVFLRRHVMPSLKHVPGWGTALISIAAMLFLFRHGELTGGVPGIGLDLLAVLVVFPAIVLFSSGITSQPSLASAGLWSGRFSYPMYVFQNAVFMFLAAVYKTWFGGSITDHAPWVALPLLATSIAVGLAVDRWLEPWGAGLMRRWLLPAKPKQPAVAS